MGLPHDERHNFPRPYPDTEDRLGLRAGVGDEYAIVVLDALGNVTSWSSGAEHLMGYRAEEIIGRPFTVFYPPKKVAVGHPGAQLAQAAETGSHLDEDWRQRQDGTRFWASIVLVALRAADGGVRGFASLTRDETESHARLRRSSQRFTDLFSLSPVGMGRFDESAHVVDANAALCDLLGYQPHHMQGMGAADLIHPNDHAGGFLPRVAGPGAPTGRRRVPHRILARVDGEPVHCDLHFAPSVENNGRLLWLVAFQDVTDRHRNAERLHYHATHDELTGLPNRKAVNDLLTELLDGAGGKRVAVLFCDVDNFKRINDSLGHDAGDDLLVALARRLEQGLPRGCTPARLSGDEFVIVCPDVDAVGGVDGLALLASALLRTTVPVQGQLIRVSSSVGAAVTDASRAGGEDLLRCADAAMFEAKLRGSGRISLARRAPPVGLQLPLEAQLCEALENDGLTLHYQPVVAVDGAVVAAEALVRWPHPERGLLAPDIFLPLAAQGGLLRDLDRWVLRTALREAATWPMSDGQPVRVAVNLAHLTPGDPKFLDEVTEIITESGIDWHRVVLELVETYLIELSSQALTAMRDLSSRGVRFAVDDFGTGYSSLARLRDLPVQIIKTDRRFVAGLGTDPCDLAMAKAVADMARALGRSCIAEGVETAIQYHLLAGLGVDAYQGWLFSPAVPPRELRAIFDRTPLRLPNQQKTERC